MSNYWYRESLKESCYTTHLLLIAVITIIVLYPYVEESIIRKYANAEGFAELSDIYPVEDLKYFTKCDKRCDININPEENLGRYKKSNIGCWTPSGGQGKICMTENDVNILATRGKNK